MIKKYMNKLSNRMILFVILTIQIFFMIFYCNMKSGYFVDELWSYGLANSYYHAQIWEDGALDTFEIDSSMFKDYIVVNEGEEFAYDSVVYNQTRDSHPPLFYMVLHTISSFFPGEFSKWFGLVPNIIYYAITIIFLYKIAKLLSNDRFFPFYPVLLYGFSIAAVNTVTFIRMYMLLTMWCLIFAYVHLKFFMQKKIECKDLILLLISTFGGVFTQNFFIIFACPWVILCILWMVCRRDWKNMIKYIGSGAVGGGLALALYPTILYNLIGQGASHSQTTANNMHNFSDWAIRIKQYMSLISSQMFGSIFLMLILILIIAMVMYVITHILWHVHIFYEKNSYRIQIETNNEKRIWVWKVKRQYYLIGVMAIAVGFYFVIVAKISPWIVERYMLNVFPFFVILFCTGLYSVYKVWKLKNEKRLFAMIISILLIGGLTYYANDPHYLYANEKEHVAISESYKDVPCVYIYTTAYIMIDEALELQNYERLYQTYYENVKELIPEIEIDNSKLVIYVDKILNNKKDDFNRTVDLNVKECVEEVMELTNLQHNKFLYEDEKAEVYLLYN